MATSLKLSATELRTMTKWPDAVVLEFLSLQGSVSEITEVINIVINNVTTAITLESQNQAGVATLNRALVTLREQVSALDTLPGKIANLKRDLLRVSNANQEQDAALGALNTKVTSNKRDQRRLIENLNEQLMAAMGLNAKLSAKVIVQADQIASLNEQMVTPDYTLLSRLTREVDARMDLAQQLAGS